MKEQFSAIFEAELEQGNSPLFVVRRNTQEFGEKYVVRMQVMKKGPPAALVVRDEYALADSLDGVRKNMPDSCEVLARMPSDDAVVVETWL